MKKYSAIIFLLVLTGMTFPILEAQSTPEPMHPVLTFYYGSGTGANTITNLSESYYTNSFIPHNSPRSSVHAPAVVAGDTGWSWSSSSPTQIVSTPSGIVFPNNNAAYPVQTQSVTVFLTTATNNLTRTVNAPYYTAADNVSQSLVFNLIDYNKLVQLRSDLGVLTAAYINSGSTPTTRDDNFARRIALALLDWARWHPSYYLTAANTPVLRNITTNWLMTNTPASQQPERASDHNGPAHEWDDTEVDAFDAIYSSVALTNLNAEMGYDVRGFITTNLFFDEGDYFVNHFPVQRAIESNLSGPYAILPEVARVLNRPDYIIWMDAYLTAAVPQNLRRDGCYENGLEYAFNYMTGNESAATNTQNYFLTRSATNALLLAVSNRAAIFSGIFSYGLGQMQGIAWPNGELPSFGDTAFDIEFPADNIGNSGLLPSYGHVAIGAGTNSLAVQVNQSFAGTQGHMRPDMSAFTLWAFTNSYLENIHYYNSTPGRQFCGQILSHNAVTIDRTNELPNPSADTYGNGDLTLYEPGNNGLALTEIDGQRAYSAKASRYQRLMLLNTVDFTKPYVVDVMRVTGGTNHDYTLHGAIAWDQSWQCSFPLVTNSNPYPMLENGEIWVEPATYASAFPYYGFWRNVSSNAEPASSFQITYLDTNRVTARDLRLWMTDNGTANVYLGMTPNPGRANTTLTPPNFYSFWRPSAIVRHRIPSGTLSDLFVSVIEPFNAGVSNIVSVTRLPMSGTTNESVGLKITFKDGRTDTYIVNLNNPKVAGATIGAASVSTADGQYALTGRVGLCVDQTNGSSRVWSMNATDFKYPGRELATPTNVYLSGWIAGSTRKYDGASYDAFTTTTPLPTGVVLRNKYLSLIHGALATYGTNGISELFKIDQVVYTNGLYSICFTNDHYLEITNGVTSVEQVAPLRTFTTSNSFEIAMSASAQQISAIADQNILSGSSTGPLNFTFGDLGGTAGLSLQVLANSTNQTLIPSGNLVVGGSGTNRTITVTPVAGLSGSSAITVSVTDGVWTNSRSFMVTVATNSTPILVWSGDSGAWDINTTANWNSNTVKYVDNDAVVFDDTSLGVGPFTVTLNSGVNPSGVTVNNVTKNYTFSTTAGGKISGATGLSKSGAGILNVTTANDYTGDTTISAGTLQLGAANVIPGGAGKGNVSVAGTLDLNTFSETVNGLSGSGTVDTLEGGSPTFTVGNNDQTSTFSGTIKNTTGTLKLIKTGAGTLTLSGTNTYSGSTTISGGSISVSSSANLPSASPLTLSGGGILTFTADPHLSNDVTIAAGQTGTFNMKNGSYNVHLTGNYANVAGTLVLDMSNLATTDWYGFVPQTANGPAGVVQVNGSSTNNTQIQLNTPPYQNFLRNAKVVLNTPSKILYLAGGNGSATGMALGALDGGNASTVVGFDNCTNCTVTINGTADGNFAGLILDGYGSARSNNLVKAGNSTQTLSGTNIYTGITTLNGGIVRVGAAEIAGISGPLGKQAANAAGTILFGGGTLQYSGANQNDYSGRFSTTGSQSITIDTAGQTVAFGTRIAGAGTSLTKLGAGTLILSGTNSYTGNTTVSSGTLALLGSGSVTNSANLAIATGATLDVSGRADGKLTLVSGQTISGSGTVNGLLQVNSGATVAPGAGLGILTVSSNVVLQGTTLMELNKTAATNDVLQTSRALTYGGTLSLTNLSGTFANGDNFKLFSAASYSGAFTRLAPVIPAINFAWNTNGLTNGILSVVSSPTTPPQFGSIVMSGTNLILSGTNGVPNWPCVLLSATNLALPLNQWTAVATNQFDAGGNLNYTNSQSANASQVFYRLQLN